MVEKPKAKSAEMATELDKVEEQLTAIDQNCKDLTIDRANMAPKQDVEPQTKLSSTEIDKSKEIYLKPRRAIASKEKFNEKYREDYNFQKEYVRFIAENREIIGETIELWTKPFSGMPAEEWAIPTGKPIWAPRYVAERIKACSYHRLVMQQNVVTESNHVGQLYGALAVDTSVQRLDALPVSTRKSVFMGASNF